jgi:hypothetical protein
MGMLKPSSQKHMNGSQKMLNAPVQLGKLAIFENQCFGSALCFNAEPEPAFKVIAEQEQEEDTGKGTGIV